MAPSSPTGNDNTATVEELIRYASARFAAAHLDFRPSKMSKLIRKAEHINVARDAVDNYLNDRLEDASWNDFELFVNGYADPTGAHAVRNVEISRHGTVTHNA